MHPLRAVRLVISSVIMIVVTAVFLDVDHLVPPHWFTTILSLQFGPAALKAFSGARGAAIILSSLIILTLVFGRVYCSHLCPLGTLQDIVIWLRGRSMKHRKYPYDAPRYWIHYAVTAAVIATALFGSMLALNLLEPYSNFGRMLTHLGRPVVITSIDALRIVTEWAGGIGIIRRTVAWPGWWVMGGSLAFLVFIAFISYRYGRLFCNLLCPVGGVLSIFSHRPLFAVTIEGEACIDCGLCQRVCRARCIDSERRKIETAACVGCFDCLEACPTQGMKLSRRRSVQADKNEKTETHIGRRRTIKALTSVVAGVILPGSTESERQSAFEKAKGSPVVPPGGKDAVRFTNLCTGCQMCVSACPTQVIQPALAEYGWDGVFQARMEYAVNYCTFDCVACTEVCPTGALLHLTIDAKHTLQLGKTTFVKEDCIVETKKKDCGACAEHCPTKAVKMVPYGKLMIPEVDNEYCIGCGACEHACPTVPRRAIFVVPNAVHQTAKKRVAERTAPIKSVPEEFPF